MVWRRCLAESLEIRIPLSVTPTDISIGVSANQAVYGQAITLTASVGASPTAPSEGTVTFSDNGNVLGTSSVSSGSATLANVTLGLGSHQITAAYSDSLGNYVSSATTAQSNSFISTIAGNGTVGYSGNGGPAISAELNTPHDVLVNSVGDLFIVDQANNCIREVNHATGVITTVAGDGTLGYSGDGGLATSARLYRPTAIAMNAIGDLFIADSDNCVIREVNHSTGIITTIAGNGVPGYSGDGGAATSAKLFVPWDVAVDAAGDLFIADYAEFRVREVDHVTGIITTVAGDGTMGYSGDGGLATAAEISYPSSIAVDAAGDLFIADDHRIREVNHSTGIITTVAGDGFSGDAGDGGLATSAKLMGPSGLSVDSQGNLYFSDGGVEGVDVREVSHATGIITTIAGIDSAGFGGDGGPADLAQFAGSVGTAVDSAGNLFIADSNNERVREITSGLTVTVLAAPAPVDDVYVIGSGTVMVSAADGLLVNDIPAGTLTVNAGSVTGATGGAFTFHADGSFVYAPLANFAGYDQAQYTVSDGLGGTKTATVTVLSQAGGVVWKFYESVLGRNPEDAGLQYWINDLAHGGSTGDMAVAFGESDELLDQIIGGYYQQYLGRGADIGGLDAWKSVWRTAGGPETVQANIAASPEFFEVAGGTTSDWLTAIYQRVLHRAPDQQGYDYWLQKLVSHESQVDVVLSFLESTEAFSDDVTMWFEQDFGVTPPAQQLDFYVGQMRAGGSDAAIESELASTPEYSATVPTAGPGAAIRLPDYSFQPVL